VLTLLKIVVPLLTLFSPKKVLVEILPVLTSTGINVLALKAWIELLIKGNVELLLPSGILVGLSMEVLLDPIVFVEMLVVPLDVEVSLSVTGFVAITVGV
jgi:hypothetical protein